ncbi:MAG: RNA polymerase sigma-70 factor [Candidatus Cyclobacteriaceae bacterium M3_2C_046]
MKSNSDDIKTLIRLFVENNDEVAFTSFFKCYYSRLIDYSMIFLKDEVLAQEVVSDVFYKLLKQKHKLLKIENVSAYLFLSCKNQSLTYLKKHKLRPINSLEFFNDNLSTGNANPEGSVIAQELQEVIDQSIDNLPPRRKLVFQMIKDDGLSYKEVAELLGVSTKTVDNQLASAIAELRKKVAAYLNHQNKKVIMKIAQMVILMALVIL